MLYFIFLCLWIVSVDDVEAALFTIASKHCPLYPTKSSRLRYRTSVECTAPPDDHRSASITLRGFAASVCQCPEAYTSNTDRSRRPLWPRFGTRWEDRVGCMTFVAVRRTARADADCYRTRYTRHDWNWDNRKVYRGAVLSNSAPAAHHLLGQFCCLARTRTGHCLLEVDEQW